MKTNTLIRSAAALSLAFAALAAQAAGLGSNLIVNGDAEAGAGAWTAYADADLFQSVSYGSNWVLPTQPGPVDRGAKMFAGQSSAYSAGFQTIDVSALTASFAAGTTAFDLNGYLGGWTSQGDNAQLMVTFIDAASADISMVTLGPVTPGDRGNQTGLFYRQVTGFVPVGTSAIKFDLSMERQGGGDNDGYADNLAFVMSAAPVPEPETYGLLALGLGFLTLTLRRRKA
ncbi:PEP-CTERM sorting domain-containing protein [Roseateles oligotrophus]|uniref:PEP-CTERM sorting domain-containing protein n=1 Tax=Roseateles oligotrophus TaxID=1769250 RepID=A0ABT2YL86_9BURK|nr:PEP-CTERM sorting domain-containing protein [Roseateles oligotrophus]MCV2370814.1 PEP-CTERM sorting domain-containing protein [Roseateles oligotrophus]